MRHIPFYMQLRDFNEIPVKPLLNENQTYETSKLLSECKNGVFGFAHTWMKQVYGTFKIKYVSWRNQTNLGFMGFLQGILKL